MSIEVTEAQAVRVGELLAAVQQITRAHRDAKDLYFHRFAPDYNVFDFIKPDEMRLSEILAWFLDPHKTHGQGARFLHLLLGALRVDARAEDVDRATVKTEVPVKNGRLDILVDAPSFQLAIENKPWAGDLETQLTRYFAHFDNLGAPVYRVIYLTPKGTAPSDRSISERERDRRIATEQLYLWSSDKNVLAWLGQCRAECQADRVSIFIDEFSRYIQAEFEGVKDRTMSEHLLDEIAASADKVSGAMQIILLTDSIRNRLLSDLRQQLLSKLTNCHVELSGNPGAKWSGLMIDYSEQSPYRFGFEFQNTQFNGLIVGVSRRVEKSQARSNEYEALQSSFGAGNQDGAWLWFRYVLPTDSLLAVARDWQTAAEPWIEIANGTLASKIVEAFMRTHSVLTACGVG